MKPLILSSFVIVLAGCAGLDSPLVASRSSMPVEPAQKGGWSAVSGGSEGVLYARDGSPVGRSRVERVDPGRDAIGHPLEESGGSRLVLLDLYQLAVDERDELTLEVGALNDRIEQERQRYTELERRFHELEATHEATRLERLRLEEQNLELAGRLTMAQIRRLEAEKLLLQSTLEWRRRSESPGSDGEGQ